MSTSFGGLDQLNPKRGTGPRRAKEGLPARSRKSLRARAWSEKDHREWLKRKEESTDGSLSERVAPVGALVAWRLRSLVLRIGNDCGEFQVNETPKKANEKEGTAVPIGLVRSPGFDIVCEVL